jgi:hypothetical protein
VIDTHLRLLREIARRSRRRLDEHDTHGRVAGTLAGDRRNRLAHLAARAARQVKDAEARRLKHRNAQRP